MSAQNPERDERIFTDFAQCARLAVVPGSLETRRPPEPDVRVIIEGRGQVAFELAEVVDSTTARTLAVDIKSIAMVTDYYRELPAPTRAAVDAKFGEAHLWFGFSAAVTLAKRRSVLDRAFELLLHPDVPSCGQVLANVDSLSGVLDWVRIRRIHQGPTFNVTRASMCNPSALGILMQKFSKKYTAGYPIELLLHTEIAPLQAIPVWLPEVEVYVDENLESSPFERVWLYEMHDNRIVYTSGKGHSPVHDLRGGVW